MFLFAQVKKKDVRANVKAAEDKDRDLERQKRELNPYWKDGGAGLPPAQVRGVSGCGVFLRASRLRP